MMGVIRRRGNDGGHQEKWAKVVVIRGVEKVDVLRGR